MTGSGRLRVGVVGVGHLGRHHARLLSELDAAELVGVADIDEARAREVAAAAGTAPYYRAGDLLERVDAVTVAVPTAAHCEVAQPFLERGVSVLVEKPMAASLADADALVAAARASGAVLAVGHTERYNPAFRAARPLISSPRFVEVHRLGALPDRSLEIDVVFDLMIHDLDVLLALVGSPVESLEAVGVPVLTGRVDIANARLRFASGCIANLTASRISRERIRKARFFQPDSYLSVDYHAREVEAWRLVRHDGRPSGIEGGRLPVAAEEPLRNELEDFLGAVVDGRRPEVAGEDGRRALALAERINGAIEQEAGRGARAV